MTKDEALDLALDALEAIIHWYGVRDKNDVMMPPLNQNPEIKESMDAITAIKQARSAPVQEPVAFEEWFTKQFEEWLTKQHGDPEEIGFLQALRIAYIAGQDSITAPPAAQRQWVGLTDEEYFEIGQRHWVTSTKTELIHAEIEAKLKEKNT